MPQSQERERGPTIPLPSSAGEDLPDPVPQRTFVLLVIATVTWALYTGIDAAAGHRTGFRVNGAVAIGTLALTLWVRLRPGRAAICAHLAVALSIFALVGISLVTGLTASPVIWYLACIPLFMGYLRGARATLVWAGVCVACIAALEIVRQVAPITPEYLVGGADFAGRIVSLVAVVTAFSLVKAINHGDQLARLQESKRAIRDLLQEAQRRAAELAAARDAALDASRAKGNFLAVMSHEIRTPLNAVLGLAGVLLDAPLPREQRDIVRTIRSSGDVLLSLLNDILDFSKIEAGRLELEQAPFDVSQCAAEALELFAAAAAAKDIRLHRRVEPGVPPRLRGDATRVRQILVNLVSNAVKFTASGEVEVGVAAEPAPDAEGEHAIHCSVRDTGIGIPASRMGELFDQFSQADASMTRRFGGTGLGLAICRALAERMGGRVWAESEEGKGSTFHVTFRASAITTTEDSSPADAPLLEKRGASVAVAEREPSSSRDEAARPLALDTPLRILVAEDNPVNQMVMRLLLQRLGYRPDMVGNGIEAVAAMSERAYDLVLMDMRMPEMDGIEATRRIRAEVPAHRQPRIIALTANVTVEDRQQCLDAGMDDFLAKPVVASDLERAIQARGPHGVSVASALL